MKDQLLTGLLPSILLITGCSAQKREIVNLQARPNVIYIYADDLGIGDLSCYGATKISTPNIDKLAGQGAQFTNAYASSAISTPSRFCLLTGKYPWRQENTGIARGNAGMVIDTACVTLADVFKKARYNTGVVGKWHLGLGGPKGPDWNHEIKPSPLDLGFDYQFLIPATVDRVPCVFVENKHVVNLDPNDPIQVNYDTKVGNWPTGKENPELLKMHPSQGHDNTIINGISRIGYMTGGKSALWIDEDIASIITNKAKDFITANKSNPFFLYFGTQDIHVPRIPNKRFAGKSGLGVRGDVILQLDWTVGEIMNTLDSLGIADNTMIVFTSDNGPVIDDGYKDEAQERLNGHTPMGLFRGGKYSAYEAGTRVPFIVRWPAAVKPTKQQALFSQVDMFASLASLIHQPIKKGVAPDSRNSLPTLLCESTDSREYVIEQNLNNTLAIVKGDWKYIEPSNAPSIEFYTKMELGNSSQPQLYNLAADPCEHNNLANDNKNIVRELAAILQKEKNKKQK